MRAEAGTTPPTHPVEIRNLELARRVARVWSEQRAADVVVLDMRTVCDFTDFFVIATAASWPQMKALTREGVRCLREAGAEPRPYGPLRETCWLLLDCGDVVLHIFDHQARDFYGLEDLWGDAARVDLVAGNASGNEEAGT